MKPGLSSYSVLRTRDDSIYISGTYAQKTLNDNILGTSVADRTINSGTAAFTRDMDEGQSGDNGYLVTPELKYALPEIYCVASFGQSAA